MGFVLYNLHVPFPKCPFRLHQSLEIFCVTGDGKRMSGSFVTAPWQVACDCYACLLWYWHLAGEAAWYLCWACYSKLGFENAFYKVDGLILVSGTRWGG